MKYQVHLQARRDWGPSSLLLLLLLLFKQPCFSPLLREERPALPKLLFSSLMAELFLGTSRTKGLAHFYSTRMPASPGGEQNREEVEVGADRLVTPNHAQCIFSVFTHKVKYQMLVAVFTGLKCIKCQI